MKKQMEASQIISLRISHVEKTQLEALAREVRKHTGDYASLSTVARMAMFHGVDSVRKAAGIKP